MNNPELNYYLDRMMSIVDSYNDTPLRIIREEFTNVVLDIAKQQRESGRTEILDHIGDQIKILRIKF